MNENNNYLYEYESEIDLIDLMFYLLKQWRILIAAILIGALVGGGIYFVKKQESDRAATILETEMEEAKVGTENEQTVAELKENYQISEDVERNMELAYQYRQLYRKQLEYNQNSPIMQINPSAVYSGELEYYISAGIDTGVVALLYQNILNGSDILSEIKEAADLPYQEQYVRELIECSVERENDATINVNNDESLIYKNATVTFSVNASNEEDCQQMLHLIRNEVEKLNQECVENYEEYEMIPINDSVNLVANSDYLSRQKSNTDQLNTYRNTMTTLENAFTEEELVYYNRVYLSRDYVVEEDVEADNMVSKTVVQPESVSWVKSLIIGIFLMVFVWGGGFLVKYLMDNTIKTPGELKTRYRLSMIGLVKSENNFRKGFDGWLFRTQTRTWGTDATLENIGSLISAMDVPAKLLLCMEGDEEKLETAVNKLCESTHVLEKAGSLQQNGKLIDGAKEKGGIVFAVTIGGTYYAKLERELELCRIYHLPVKGVVVIV